MRVIVENAGVVPAEARRADHELSSVSYDTTAHAAAASLTAHDQPTKNVRIDELVRAEKKRVGHAESETAIRLISFWKTELMQRVGGESAAWHRPRRGRNPEDHKERIGEGLQAGDIGTVVHIHEGGAGYEVEFMTLAGETLAVVTLLPAHIRPIARRDVAHVRELAATGS